MPELGPRMRVRKPLAKPSSDYRVPSMGDIATVRGSNRLTVVSTFSGAGGSCLGFEMAGYRLLWANEFIPEACKTYALNHPDVIVDGRDIRKVTAADIFKATGLKAGELDVFNGSPPCISFSTAGKREQHWGKVRPYSDGTQQRSDDLFFEYARLLKDLQPRVFVAENVSGLVKGTSWGYFEEIIRALKSCGYRVKSKLLDAQWLGVPQYRQRLIFIGVREDLKADPVHPAPLRRPRYSIRDALPHLQSVRWDSGGLHGSRVFDVKNEPIQTIQAGGGGSQTGYLVTTRPGDILFSNTKTFGRAGVWSGDKPSPTIMAGGSGGPRVQRLDQVQLVGTTGEPRKFTIFEVKRLCGFPDDFVLTGSFRQQWERLGNCVPPVMMFHIARTLRDQIFSQLGPLPAGASEAVPG